MMQVLQEERSSLIHTVDGEDTVEVPFQERIHQKWTDQLHMLQDGSQRTLWQTSSAGE